jgi:hypothetical protein
MTTKLNEALGSAWMFYQHFNPNLPGNEDMASAEEILQLNEDEQLDEGVSGQAWMFYNQYNPDIIKAMEHVISGAQVEDVINKLLENTLEPGKMHKMSYLTQQLKNKRKLIPVIKAAKDAVIKQLGNK